VSESLDLRRARVVVSGRVQAVGFRAGAHVRARSLGVAGWVRNNPDGTVEAELEGPADSVESLLGWFGRGPHGAYVEDIRVEWREPLGEYGFDVR
jgi:acylphosphatase